MSDVSGAIMNELVRLRHPAYLMWQGLPMDLPSERWPVVFIRVD